MRRPPHLKPLAHTTWPTGRFHGCAVRSTRGGGWLHADQLCDRLGGCPRGAGLRADADSTSQITTAAVS